MSISEQQFLDHVRKRCEEDFEFFVRYFFKTQKGVKFRFSWHHHKICEALMKVWRGEVTYLMINIPPRYSKTEIVVKLFSSWCYAKNSTCEFIHLSYSDLLAMDNSSAIKNTILSKEFQQLWPIELTKESDGAWKTAQGGVFLARSSGGQVTGYGAGKVDDFRDGHGFGGCFPYWQSVNTDKGPIPIGEICEKGLNAKVESINTETGEVEYKEIDRYWHNPENDILEVVLDDGSYFHCTPNHEIYTKRGKVRADELLRSDVLVTSSQSLNRINRATEYFGGFFASERSIKSNLDFIGGVHMPMIPLSVWKVFCDTCPCLPELYLSDYTRSDAVTLSEYGRLFRAFEDVNGLLSGQLCARSSLKDWKRSVLNCVPHVVRFCPVSKIAKAVVATISVYMPYLNPFSLLADKSSDNGLMYVARRNLSRLRKHDLKVSSALSVWSLFEHSPFNLVNLFSCSHDSIKAFDAPHVANHVKRFKTFDRSPVLIRKICHVDKTYCLEVRGNHNFTVGEGRVLVSNCLLVDDPNKPDDALSEVKRNAVNRRWDETLKSRLNSTRTPVIVIMQRLHEDDFCGMLLRDVEYKFEQLILPAILDEGTDQERALWPEKHSLEQLKAMQVKNSYVFAGQMQQSPRPLGGGIIKSSWFGFYDVLPKIKYRAIFVDTAQKEKESNDYQVASLWGLGEDGDLYLIDMMRDKFQAYELEVRIPAFWNKAKADRTSQLRFMGVEDKASGTQLIQNIRHKIRPAIPLKEIERSRSKLERVMDVQGYIESGYVKLPRSASFLSDFISECEAFTANDSHPHDDQIDTMCDAITMMLAKKHTLYGDVEW